jgi:hypothetical protein
MRKICQAIFQHSLRLLASVSIAVCLILINFTTYAQTQILVTGPVNTCNSSLTYTIPNPGAGVTVTWTVQNRTLANVLPSSQSSTSCTLAGVAPTDAFRVIATYTTGGTTFTGTAITYSCCDGGTPSQTYTNANSANFITNFGTNDIQNQVFLIYGTLTINANLVFRGCTFIMAEGSEIVIDGAYGFFDNCDLIAFCSYRWKGIRVINNASLKFDAGTTLNNARYGVHFSGFNQNGAHDLKNSGLFGNLVGIFADQLTAHNISWANMSGLTIDGTMFAITPYFLMPATPICAINLNFVNDFPLRTTDQNNPCIISNYAGNAVNIQASNIYFDGVQFNNIAGTAINANNQTAMLPIGSMEYSYKINNCTFNNIGTGINIMNARGRLNSPLEISGNTFNSGITPTTPLTTAINVAPNSTALSYFDINSNFIYTATNAITVNLASTNNTGVIYLNYLSLQAASSTNGILINGGTGINIYSNDIVRTTSWTGAVNAKVGLDITLSAAAFVDRNTFINLGSGVTYRNNCALSQNRCNKFITSQRGFWMIGATMTNQGSNSRLQNNSFGGWNPANLKIFGTCFGPLPNWYYKNSGNNVLTASANAASLVSTTSTWSCPVVQPQRPLMSLDSIDFPSDSTLEDLLTGEYETASELSHEATLAQIALVIENNQAALTDSTYLAIYNDYITSNYAILDLISKYSGEGDFSSAQALIDSFIPARDDEFDRLIVLGITNRLFSDSTYVLSSRDSALLLSIATKSTFMSGLAALQARSLLNLRFEDILPEYYRTTNLNLDNNQNFVSYTKMGRVYSFYMNNELITPQIEVFNSAGQLIKRINSNQLSLEGEQSNLIIRLRVQDYEQIFRNL